MTECRHNNLIPIAVAATLLACGDSTSTPTDAVDTRPSTEVDTVTPRPRWTFETLGPGGRQLRAAVDSQGRAAVAHYDDASARGGLCADAGSGERSSWRLLFTEPSGEAWQTETVADIVHLGPPRGFAFAFAPDDTPHIAALSGEPIPFYCGAHDLGLYRRTASWTSETVVEESNQAATGEPASDFGTVVGLWPALVFDADGAPIIAYKDVHGGGLQGDDFRRADLELAWRTSPSGSWRHLPVEPGQGSGDFIQVALDSQGRVYIVYFHPRDELSDPKRGLWVLRGQSQVGGDSLTWERVRLFAGGISERPSVVIAPDDTPLVAWYDGALGLPMVASLGDDDGFESLSSWSIADVGDRVYDEGRHPVLAVSSAGLVGLAYQRCGRASDGIGDCDPTRDAVVFAWRDGPFWEREVLEETADDETGLCGTFTGLVFAGARPHLFYQCLVQGDNEGDGFEAVLRVAIREAP